MSQQLSHLCQLRKHGRQAGAKAAKQLAVAAAMPVCSLRKGQPAPAVTDPGNLCELFFASAVHVWLFAFLSVHSKPFVGHLLAFSSSRDRYRVYCA